MNPHGIRQPIPAPMRNALRAHTFRVTTAAAAYYADEAVRNGLCATCKQRKPDARHRDCQPCRKRGKP